MSEFFQKALWVALPVAIASAVSLAPYHHTEIQTIVYLMAAMLAAFGWWICGARRRRHEAEIRDQQRWDALNKRLDLGDLADRAMLRNELVRMHREWVEQEGYITLEALEYADNTYEIYHSLGGNGSGTKLYEDLCKLPIQG